MPLFFFRLKAGNTVTDSEETALPDLQAARAHARKVARELTWRSAGFLGAAWSEWILSVHDEQGAEVFSIAMDAFALT